MKILCVFGQHNYGDPKRGVGYEYTNFIPSLQRLGHEIVFFESLNKARYKSFSDLNRQFLKSIEKNKPDLIFCVLMGYELWTETLQIVRETSGAVLVNWATDDSWKYDQFSRFMASQFDLYATTYPAAVNKSKRQGIDNVLLTQWGANADHLQQPIPASACRWDVSFIGMAYGNRVKWVSRLGDRGIRVNCFGHGWENGPVKAQEIPNIVQHSIISLNFGDSNWMLKGVLPYRSRQIKARVFEVPGYGGFLMTENAEHLEDFFHAGREIVLFDHIDDLAEKIRFYLTHPEQRDEIARAGYRRTRREHTYDKRFGSLLTRVRQLQPKRSAQTDRPAGNRTIDYSMANRLDIIHQPNRHLVFLKQVLVIFCSLIWGQARGPRAARRILFEFSWRLCGKKTYSASGWPGRLFYRES